MVVLVTGASSGIGRAAAHALAEKGHHLALLARGVGPLEDAAAECAELGAASTMVLPADVGDDEAVAGAVEAVTARHGRLDGVINCAGVVAYGRIEEVPAAVFDRVVQTNLLGTVNVLRHVLPVLRAQQQGSVVLTGSLIGHIAVPTMSAYCVSKWGVRAVAREALVENVDVPDVHISYVSLPGVDTPIYEQAAYAGGPNGRPPAPVWSAERAAALLVRALMRPRAVTHGGLFDPITRLGFRLLPRLYDVLVGPMFVRFAADRGRPRSATDGNVLSSTPEGNHVSGGHRFGLLGLLGVGRSPR